MNEKSNLNPISHYARIKIMSEKALLNSANNNFKPTILRLGTVFGPSKRMRFDLVVNTMSKFAYLSIPPIWPNFAHKLAITCSKMPKTT